jgi:hypothetical protein
MMYRIRESSAANSFTLLMYGLTFLAILVFVGILWLKILLSLLLILFLVTDLQRYKAAVRDDSMVLTLHDKSGKIDMHQTEGDTQYSLFRLFANRWFLVLQLKNEKGRKDLLIVPDRFRSMREYLQFRYAIIQMSRN